MNPSFPDFRQTGDGKCLKLGTEGGGGREREREKERERDLAGGIVILTFQFFVG